jgi:hypothetical protein
VNQGLLVVALAVHEERKVLAVGCLARQGGDDQRVDVGPDLRPDVLKTPAQCTRMLRAQDRGVGIVVEESEFRAPGHEHRKARLQQETDGRPQGLGPRFRRSERRLRPVVAAHQGTHRAAASQEVRGSARRLRRSRDVHVEAEAGEQHRGRG